MDGSNLDPQAPKPNIAPNQPVIPQTPISAESSNDSNKIIIWFVVGLILIVLVVGGIYFFLSRQQATTPQTQTTTQTSPSSSPQDNLEGDLNNINVPSGADDVFAPVDQDLQQL